MSKPTPPSHKLREVNKLFKTYIKNETNLKECHTNYIDIVMTIGDFKTQYPNDECLYKHIWNEVFYINSDRTGIASRYFDKMRAYYGHNNNKRKGMDVLDLGFSKWDHKAKHIYLTDKGWDLYHKALAILNEGDEPVEKDTVEESNNSQTTTPENMSEMEMFKEFMAFKQMLKDQS